MQINVFISQPMNGKSEEEIIANRNEAISAVKQIYGEGEELHIIDSYCEDFCSSLSPLYYLSKSIEKLSEANLAYFARDWENYRGCRIEHEIVEAYEIPFIEWKE